MHLPTCNLSFIPLELKPKQTGGGGSGISSTQLISASLYLLYLLYLHTYSTYILYLPTYLLAGGNKK